MNGEGARARRLVRPRETLRPQYRRHFSWTVVVPIPGGEFLLGSPESEEGRNEDEGPQRRVSVEPFWMGKHEVTWDEYDIWTFNMDIQRRELQKVQPTPGALRMTTSPPCARTAFRAIDRPRPSPERSRPRRSPTARPRSPARSAPSRRCRRSTGSTPTRFGCSTSSCAIAATGWRSPAACR